MYETIEEVMEAAEVAGCFYFDPLWIAEMKETVLSVVYGGRFFIVQNDIVGKVRYTVRGVDNDGWVYTIGKFGQHKTLKKAVKAAEEAAKYLESL